jgi:N-acetylmuramoyl-L-alanine amidase
MSKADDALGVIQQGFEKNYIPEVERLIKERKEQEEEAAKAAAAQKLIEDNLREQQRRREEEEIEKEKRKYKDYKNEMLKWGEYDVSKYNNRYETEAEYFNNLSENDPFTYKNLKEKFKYFNPAFHSITPEGFNARLTFLQQCTRQGATIEVNNTSSGSDGIISSDALAKTAANLAFGRMPVCVLRIGDFIHTKVIIKSMSINYGSNGAMQWDLNPEGIGVQPMYAKVSMNIAIIGGQSLETPINRLQNALSFNYYANAEVYDNRADSAIYKNRDIEYKYVFDPTNQEESNWGEKGDLLGGGNMVPAIDDPNIKTNDESLRRREQENSGDNLDKNSGQDLDSTKDNWLFSKDKFSTILTYEGEIVYNSSVNVIPSGKFNIKYMNEPQIIISYVKDDTSLTIKDVTLKDCKFEAIPGKNIDGNEYTHKEAILKLDENIENYRQYLLDYYKNGEETETINKDIYSFKCKDVITNLINKDSSEINKTLIKNNIDYVVILDSGHHENISGKFSPVFTEEDLLDDDVLSLIEDVDLLKECSDIQDDGESYRFREYKYVKKLVESIKKEIEKDNEIKVELTHIDNTLSDATKDVAHRVDYVNNTIIGKNEELKKYLLVSVHCNASDKGQQWQNVNGWKIYTSPKYDSVGENKELYYKSSVEMCENTVKIFNEEIFVGNPIKAKPVEAKLKLMCETKCPSVLTENFFMDSKSGLVCLINYYDNLRDLHVNSIKEYFCS